MTYKEYEKKAITTRVYDPQVAIPYVVSGLSGEMGEFYEKIEACSSVTETSKEVGDILWYLAAIRVELDLEVGDDWIEPMEKEDENEYPFALIINVGKISEQVKKYLRDDWKSGEENVFPEKRKEIVTQAWKEIMASLNYIASSDYFEKMGIVAIAKENNEKLASRAQRDQIHGAGDNR